jgi:hypothetical protein
MQFDERASRDFFAGIRWEPSARPPAIRIQSEAPDTSWTGYVRTARKIQRVRNINSIHRSSTHKLHHSQSTNRTDTDLERSMRNIADWSSYLPQDCVTTMISLGWDRST